MRLLGVVENMSGDVFGIGGADRLGEELGVPIFGSIPLDPRIRECADAGEPIVWEEPEVPRRADHPAYRARDRRHEAGAGRGDRQGAARPVLSAHSLRRRLVRQLRDKGLLEDKLVRDAFLEVPREHFVPEASMEDAYEDKAILTKQTPTGLGLSSSSQPGIMAEMLGELRLEPGQRVLEIGAGTGYNAALLQHIVGASGQVTTIDIDPETARRARRALKGSGVKVVTGDGREGHARGSPYDRIIVTASATEIPRSWLEQLVPGGLVEVPAAFARRGRAPADPDSPP
jgi:protein-L-isoaspartate(D-aspartate) O-methyltransferase